MFFGPWGSGKTYVIMGLLRHGFKVLVITTDVGGSGLAAIKIPLRASGESDLLENLVEIVLNDDSEFQSFLQDPTAFFPEIYTWDPDFLIWDGAASWQQVYLSDRIGQIPVGNNVSEAVDSGLVFEQPQWGMLRNGTFRGFHKFCALHNRVTGKIWHKVVTCQEGIKTKEKKDGGGIVETKMPLLQGAGGVLIGGAFDLIVRCKEVKEAGKDSKYFYQIKGENNMSKSRGFKLPAEMPADMYELWNQIEKQMGVVRNAKDENEVIS